MTLLESLIQTVFFQLAPLGEYSQPKKKVIVVTEKITKKRTPRPGIEPGSSAWQAEILTTILSRTSDNTNVQKFIYLASTHLSDTPSCPLGEVRVCLIDDYPVIVLLVTQPGPQTILVYTALNIMTSYYYYTVGWRTSQKQCDLILARLVNLLTSSMYLHGHVVYK